MYVCYFYDHICRIFGSRGEQIKTASFPPGGKYTEAMREGSFEMKGDRVTKLGTNM